MQKQNYIKHHWKKQHILTSQFLYGKGSNRKDLDFWIHILEHFINVFITLKQKVIKDFKACIFYPSLVPIGKKIAPIGHGQT